MNTLLSSILSQLVYPEQDLLMLLTTYTGISHLISGYDTPTSSSNYGTQCQFQDAHLNATLERINQLANDVEMADKVSQPEGGPVLVVDTNIFLRYFDALKEFVEDLEKQRLDPSQNLTVVIPGAVIGELDGQKNRDRLAWFARRASAWILAKVKERKIVRGQADKETCKSTGSWRLKEPGEDSSSLGWSDSRICDCCEYFQNKLGRPTALCSADNNLCVTTESQGIRTITPSRWFSSYEIARAILGNSIDMTAFRGYHSRYAAITSSQKITEPPSDDNMDIDDDNTAKDDFQPSHPLDLLHLQVVEHFTCLLVELVSQVGASEIMQTQTAGTAASRYAPEWTRNTKHYLEWSSKECMSYLRSKKPIKPTSPAIEVFLSIPYTRGARRGQDWSTKDWDVALRGLAAIGDAFGEGSFRESLGVLQPHLIEAFSQRMRPTGV